MKKLILGALLLSSLSAQAGIMKDLDMVCTSQLDARDKIYVSITPINGNNIMSIFTQIDGKDCNGNSVNLDPATYEAFIEQESAQVAYELNCYSSNIAGLRTELSSISDDEDAVLLQTTTSAVEYKCEKKSYLQRLRDSLSLEIGS